MSKEIESVQATAKKAGPNLRSRMVWRAGWAALLMSVAIAGPGSAWAATETWNTGTSGNWSASGSWAGGSIPPTDGTATIFFQDNTVANQTATIDSSWWSNAAQPAPVYGFVFGTSGTTSASNSKTTTISLGTGVTSLGIGAGGITSYYFDQVTLPTVTGGIDLTANQTWDVVNSGGSISTGSFTGSGVLTKSGAGSLVFAADNGSAWAGDLQLKSGTVQLTASGTGANGVLAQLGTNAMTMYQGATLQFNFGTANTTYAFATPIVFDASSTGGYTLSAYTGSNAGSTVNLEGSLSGTIGVTGGNGVILHGSGAVTEATYEISGNNSTLTSPVTVGNGTAPFVMQTGDLLVANANALGANNTLGVALGVTGTTTPGLSAGLYAVGGMTVRSNIYSDLNFNSGSVVTLDNYIGTSGTGTATFAGNISLGSANSTPNARASNTHLNASSGGTAVFSGSLADVNNGVDFYSSVIVDGGGVVELTGPLGNTYEGGTTVSEGTTLVVENVQGSATGTGSLYVGAAAESGVTGTTATAATGAPGTNGYYITGINTAGLRVGQTVTSASGGVSGVIEAINPNGTTNTIQISALPTTAGTFSDLSFGAQTGILGGAGIIRPTGANSIQVASGSMVYPGVGSASTAVTLTLDGGGTSAPLLTMSTGAAFTFNLETPGTSDEIKFFNWAAGDLVLNSNTLHLTLGSGVASGTYTLFQFYSDSGTTLVNSGITSGLDLDTADLDGYDATLNYNGTSITLSLMAVPEPSCWLLVLGGLALLALISRRNPAKVSAAKC